MMNTNHPTQDSDVIYHLAASPAFASDQTLFAARASGLHRSTDGGQSWQNMFDAFQAQTPLAALYVALSPDFSVDGHVFAAVPGGVLRSVDGGETWTSSILPSPPPVITALAVSPGNRDDGVIFAATMDDGIFRSVDRGARWTAWNFGLFDLHVLCAALSPAHSRDQSVYMGCESGIFYSLNGGLSWREADFPVQHAPVWSLTLSPHFAEDHTLWAGTESAGLFRSLDRGQTWEQVAAPEAVGGVSAILLSPEYPKTPHLLLMNDDALLVSRDDGQSFRSWRANLRFEDQPLSLVAPHGIAAGAPLWVGLASGEILRI